MVVGCARGTPTRVCRNKSYTTTPDWWKGRQKQWDGEGNVFKVLAGLYPKKHGKMKN